MTFIGIDVSKDKLDYYCERHYSQSDNTKAAIQKYLSTYHPGHRIIMEATGKYHRLAHEVAVSLTHKVMIINPYQSKHFAHALNRQCKTDRVDAKTLAEYAEKIGFKETPLPTKTEQEMQELARLLDDFKASKLQHESRLKTCTGFVAKQLTKAIKRYEEQIKEIEARLLIYVKKEEQLLWKYELLLTIPGVGSTTAVYLLSYLRELGELTKREISALAGVAPINRDSGTFKGKRFIRGGRSDIRSHLYMPVLGAATQHNKRLRAFYERLVLANKPKKVALTACIHKLIIWANAIIASGKPWSDAHEESLARTQ